MSTAINTTDRRFNPTTPANLKMRAKLVQRAAENPADRRSVYSILWELQLGLISFDPADD